MPSGTRTDDHAAPLHVLKRNVLAQTRRDLARRALAEVDLLAVELVRRRVHPRLHDQAHLELHLAGVREAAGGPRVKGEGTLLVLSRAHLSAHGCARSLT